MICKLTDQSVESLFSFLSPVSVFLFLFLLFELVFFEDLPKFPKLRLIIKGSPRYFFQVVSACHCSFVVGTQLTVQHYFCYLNVSQGLLTSAKHEEAAGEIIKDASCLNVLQTQDGLPDFPGFEETPCSYFILFHLIEDFSKAIKR